jgi:hypothetical protein
MMKVLYMMEVNQRSHLWHHLIKGEQSHSLIGSGLSRTHKKMKILYLRVVSFKMKK